MIKELNTAVVVTFAPIAGFCVGVIIGSMVIDSYWRKQLEEFSNRLQAIANQCIETLDKQEAKEGE